MSFRPLRCDRLTLAALVAAYLLLATNATFWRKGMAYFNGHTGELLLLGLGLALLTMAFLALVAIRPLMKPVFIAVLLIAAVTSHFVDSFGILFNREMIQNVALTTPSEAKHFLTADFIRHVILFGLLPAALVAWTTVPRRRLVAELGRGAALAAVAVLVTGGIVYARYPVFASTFRQHRDLIGSFNPSAPILAAIDYARHAVAETAIVVAPLGRDAHAGPRLAAAGRKVVTVVVVGETARAANFGLNGYGRETTPELAARGAVAFTDVSSCGTSTAVSVPCMFSVYPRAAYTETKARSTENLLDILGHAGLAVRWYDNDTGSMQVADRVPYEFLPAGADPRFCSDGECLDDILVERLARDLDRVAGPTVIVLHQLGSHGPAYYQRYPQRFERFTPACRTAQFADCDLQTIVNAYDNTILYTDHVLAEIIDLLKRRADLASAMIFVSDHGESLGEGGAYLHGAPYFLAPAVQTHVPMVAWASDAYRADMHLDVACLAARRDAPLSHDNFFHTVLGLMDIATGAYDARLDAFAACRSDGSAARVATVGAGRR
jgi:lipid A ethanolaminephosphotransferase